MAKHILPMFPTHECYVELFAGGAALFFMRDQPAKCEVINDINGELINLYRVVQNHKEEFVRQFDWSFASREEFKRLQALPPKYLTDIQRAARFYYLSRNAFGSKVTGQTFGTATTSASKFKTAAIEESLRLAKERLSGVFIENESWDKVVQRYDREHTFFYADPPYWQTAGYGVDFSWEQYEALAKTMSNCKGKMMLSINDHPDIRNLFQDLRITRFDLAYSISRDKTQKNSGELVICNW